jgi:hypothetical protein
VRAQLAQASADRREVDPALKDYVGELQAALAKLGAGGSHASHRRQEAYETMAGSPEGPSLR